MAPESTLACADAAADAEAACADEAAGAAVADMLAAMAAAAIASGAVAFPDAGAVAPEVGGAAAGTSVTATVTGIAVAMAMAVVAVVASCCAEAAGSVEAAVAAASPDDDFSADFAVSDFELPDFALEGGGASGLAPVLDGGAALASWLLGSLLAGGSEGAAFCDPPSLAAAGTLLEGDCRAGCCCVVGGVLPGSLALLLSTSAPKISFPEAESDLADLGGVLRKGTFVAASDVTLYTGGLSQWIQRMISKDRAMPVSKK
jgi:hypothetical protein